MSIVTRIRSAFVLATLLLQAVFFGATSSSAQDYTLASGDVLEITVFRVPELTRVAPVGFDGKIAFPPLGRIDVTGKSLEDVSQAIRDGLAEQVIVTDAQVTIDIVTARPVFVGGDVSAPGAFPYQPSLSVRRAIALAGGVGVQNDRSRLEVAQLLAQREVQVLQHLQLQTEVARLTSELNGEETMSVPTGDAASALPDAVVELERRKLAYNLEASAAERAFTEENTKIIQERLDKLEEQAAMQNRLLNAQQSELERVQDIQDRGLAVQARVQTERRAYETMLERVANTVQQITQAQQQLAEAEYDLSQFDGRRIDTLESDLQNALEAANSLRATVRGIDQQLAQLGYADTESYTIARHRFSDGKETSEEIDENTILLPGDMIEVTIDRTSLIDLDGAGTVTGSGDSYQ